MRSWGLCLLVCPIVLAGCPKKDPAPKTSTTGSGAIDAAPVVTLPPAPVDPYAAFPRSALGFASPKLRAAADLAWPSVVHRVDELDELFEDVEDEAALRAVAAKLGTFVLVAPANTDAESGLAPYDAATGTFTWRGPGIDGVKLDKPLIFTLPASIQVGEMPMGGSVRVPQPDLEATIAVPSGEADRFAAAHRDRAAIEQHYLIDIVGLGNFDNHPYVVAALRGVRVVSLPRREVLFVGAPVAPPPAWPER